MVKPTDNTCHSHFIVYRRLATSASPTRDIFPTKLSLKIHSFSEDRGKCNKTGNASISNFSTILTSDILILADSSRSSSDEAYRQLMSLPSYCFSTPCYECKPNARYFLGKKIGWFTLTKPRHVGVTKPRHVGDEEQIIPSCLDTRSPMIAPPVLLQSAFCAQKKTDWPKLDRFKFFILDILSARRVNA